MTEHEPLVEPGLDRPSVAAPRRVAVWGVVGVGLVMVALLAVLVASRDSAQPTARTSLLNKPAPTARGELADRSPFDLSRRKGSWVVLNFFTPDCVPCIREQPQLVRFVAQQRSIGSEGAEFYTIVQHASRAEVDRFFDDYGGGDWPVVYDTGFEFQTGFGVAQVPETWIVDPLGVVRGRIVGELSSAESLSAELQKMRDSAGRSSNPR